MEWLIDLIIEAIGVPPCFIDRGDPATYDWTVGDFTADGAWHDLDCSAIVPAGATAVVLTVNGLAVTVARSLKLRRKGNVNEINIAHLNVQAAVISNAEEYIVPLDSNRFLEYKITIGGFLALNASVVGWFL